MFPRYRWKIDKASFDSICSTALNKREDEKICKSIVLQDKKVKTNIAEESVKSTAHKMVSSVRSFDQ